MIPPDAQLYAPLTSVDMSSGGLGGSSSYPCKYGLRNEGPVGRLVLFRPRGANTFDARSAA
jgi:hypothetical protein